MQGEVETFELVLRDEQLFSNKRTVDKSILGKVKA